MTIEQRPSLSIALPKSYLFTSESVTEGHPDKMCDQISDAILDAIISKEIELEREGYIAPSGQPADVSRMRCACETLATTGLVAVAGEIRTQAYVDVPAIVRSVAMMPVSLQARMLEMKSHAWAFSSRSGRFSLIQMSL